MTSTFSPSAHCELDKLQSIALAMCHAFQLTGISQHHSLTLAILSLSDEGEGFCLNAGHTPLYKINGRTVERISNPGNLIGIKDSPEFGTSRFWIGPGDTVVAYTDGLVDRIAAPVGNCGTRQLVKQLAAGGGRDAKEILTGILTFARLTTPDQLEGDSTIRDDISLLCIQKKAA